jgi:hypothetical protein
MERKVVRPKIELLWFSTVDQGKQLELNAKIDGVPYPLATVVADEQDESLWLEIRVDDMIVQVPLATIHEALVAAPGNVHSEAWYEQNGYY